MPGLWSGWGMELHIVAYSNQRQREYCSTHVPWQPNDRSLTSIQKKYSNCREQSGAYWGNLSRGPASAV